jgi:hypothetical protein
MAKTAPQAAHADATTNQTPRQGTAMLTTIYCELEDRLGDTGAFIAILAGLYAACGVAAVACALAFDSKVAAC